MTSEQEYPKPAENAKPAQPAPETPTVDVAGELATQRIGAKKPTPQPEPDQAEARPLWTMPQSQAQQPAVQPSGPPPAEPVDETQRLPYQGQSGPVQQAAVQESVDQTQRLPFGSQSQSAPVPPVQPHTQPRPSQPAVSAVDSTQRLPYTGQSQAGPPPSARGNDRPAPQQSVEATQRLPFPAQPQVQPQADPQSGPLLRAPDAQPLFEQNVASTQRLPYSQQHQQQPPAPANEPPDRTLTYQMEDTAQGLPSGQQHGAVQAQPQFQQQPQGQFQQQPQGQGQAGMYGGPTPTLRFDEIQGPGDDQPLGPGEYRHFGPGVPGPDGGGTNQAAAVWRGETAGSAQQTKPKRRRAFAGWLLALAVLGIVLGILAWFYYFGAPVKVTGASVKAPTTTVGCNQTATITGTLQTNGDTGTVTYQWLRSDGTKSNVLTQHFNKGTGSANVVLLWTFNGVGSLKATATLNVISPDPTSSSATFNYSCDH